MALKTCTKCKQEKTAIYANFQPDLRVKSGFRANCRSCCKKRCIEWAHGLSPEKYTQMLVVQNGSCAICKSPQSNFKRALHVDHNHKTGEIRGLLCPRCNTGLGYLEDESFIPLARNYLNSSKEGLC